ncbi:cobalt ECF transporter S component CbiM [Xenorhabdus khoisanae]|uniref:cobalt ECF transporter S component CbiM n=1 Tax=Xenorhabdus khoisanae TaxID=880157 RepID=UPI0023583502|nr:cobalt ECF transporter S component CbiM [Xenorhabdus khoisanae]MDC9614059.1 cobalt ECF transporter S component CbiM [Xenorhabdus khoisanae]
MQQQLTKFSLSGAAITLFLVLSLTFTPQEAFAMHVMEGFLPPMWALAWWLAFLPCLAAGLVRLRQIVQEDSNQKVLLALCGAFIFVLSALKIPSVTGSCSHPTGVALAVILFGPSVVAVLGAIVLLFQALLLAHGGITTLGANGMSMAVIGPLVGYLVWRFSCKMGMRKDVSAFLCAFVADIVTYTVTSVQLGVAFPDPQLGMAAATLKFMGIFCITQLPIAVAEGLLTVLIYDQLVKRQLIQVRSA